MYEVLNKNIDKIKSSKILKNLKIKKDEYFLISCHREENIDANVNFNKLIDSLNKISEVFKIPVIFPIHPRTKKIFKKNKPTLNKMIRLVDPLGFVDYNQLQMNSFVVLSDSGTISEESSILKFRALNIRETHERHEAMEESAVIMTGLDVDRILQGIQCLTDLENDNEIGLIQVADYKIPNISIKIERIILSYINYVNRVIWKKES